MVTETLFPITKYFHYVKVVVLNPFCSLEIT